MFSINRTRWIRNIGVGLLVFAPLASAQVAGVLVEPPSIAMTATIPSTTSAQVTLTFSNLSSSAALLTLATGNSACTSPVTIPWLTFSTSLLHVHAHESQIVSVF